MGDIVRYGPHPFDKGRTPDQWAEIYNAARALVETLGGLMWKDRVVGFGEWCRLVDAMNDVRESGK